MDFIADNQVRDTFIQVWWSLKYISQLTYIKKKHADTFIDLIQDWRYKNLKQLAKKIMCCL